MQTEAKYVRMRAEVREQLTPMVEDALIRPMNGAAEWDKQKTAEILQVAFGWGLNIPIFATPSGRFALGKDGWNDGTERWQHALRVFQTGELDNIVMVPEGPDAAMWAEVQQIAKGITHVARTGIIPKYLPDLCDKIHAEASQRSGVGSVLWLNALTFDAKSGAKLPDHQRRFTAYGVQWKGRLTYWPGMKVPMGRGDSHFSLR